MWKLFSILYVFSFRFASYFFIRYLNLFEKYAKENTTCKSQNNFFFAFLCIDFYFHSFFEHFFQLLRVFFCKVFILVCFKHSFSFLLFFSCWYFLLFYHVCDFLLLKLQNTKHVNQLNFINLLIFYMKNSFIKAKKKETTTKDWEKGKKNCNFIHFYCIQT